jgi:multiple sugar transport system permease protein
MTRGRLSILGLICTLLTVVMALAWIFPIYWTGSTALKSDTDTIVVPPKLIPWPPNFEAFAYVIQNSPIFRWYLNTVIVSVSVTFFSIFFSLMCAYALSRLEFKGKRVIYGSLLVGFMLPFGALAVPLFMQMNSMNLVNSYPSSSSTTCPGIFVTRR